MKDKDFCNIDTAFYGEKVDHIDQIAMRSFNGNELKEYVEFAIQQVNGAESESGKALHKQSVTNSLPDLTLDEADVLAKETDYACYACEDTEEINWGDASAFFIEGYQYAIKKFRQ